MKKPKPPSPRNLAIAARINAGETLASVASTYSITRERVRQIAKKLKAVSPRQDNRKRRDEAMAARIIAGEAIDDVAAAYKVGRQVAYHAANSRRYISEKTLNRIDFSVIEKYVWDALRERALTLNAISKELGFSQQALWTLVKKNDKRMAIYSKENARVTWSINMAKVGANVQIWEVAQMRRFGAIKPKMQDLLNSGSTLKAISDELKISPATIYKYVKKFSPEMLELSAVNKRIKLVECAKNARSYKVKASHTA